jgi:hypothetical protein
MLEAMDSDSPMRLHPDAYHLIPAFDDPLQGFMAWLDAHPDRDPQEYDAWCEGGAPSGKVLIADAC